MSACDPTGVLERTEHGLPKWNLGNLPHLQRLMIKAAQVHFTTNLCHVCFTPKEMARLRSCARCGKKRVNPVYYCSAQCQRIDWEKHKRICGPDHQGPENFIVSSKRRVSKGSRTRARKMWRRLEALRSIIEWGASQFLRHQVSSGPEDYCVEFYFISKIEHGHPRLQLTHTNLSKKDKSPDTDLSPNYINHGQYRAHVDKGYVIDGFVPISAEGSPDPLLDRSCSVWPWILCHVSWCSVYPSNINLVTLRLLLSALLEYRIRNPEGTLFDRFKVLVHQSGWALPFMEEWLELMGEVADYDPKFDPEYPKFADASD